MTTKERIMKEFKDRWEDDTIVGGCYSELGAFFSLGLDQVKREENDFCYGKIMKLLKVQKENESDIAFLTRTNFNSGIYEALKVISDKKANL